MNAVTDLSTAVRDGRAWSADTKFQNLVSGSPYLRIKAANPSNSTNNIFIYNFGGFHPLSSALDLTVKSNITTPVTANVVSPKSQHFGRPKNPTLSISWDQATADLAGDDYRPLKIESNDFREFNQEILLLPPGASIGLSLNIGLATLANGCILHLSWWEEPKDWAK